MNAGRRGVPFVVAAPSGTGKTTVCRQVVQKDFLVEFSVSHTTRPRRDGEAEGIDYHFVKHELFQEMVDEDAFLEWAGGLRPETLVVLETIWDVLGIEHCRASFLRLFPLENKAFQSP